MAADAGRPGSEAGTYASTELDALYTVRVSGARLMLQRAGARTVALEPVSADLFAAP